MAIALVRVRQLRTAVEVTADRLLLEALKAGASTHEIAKRLDLTQATIWRTSQRIGWPDEAEADRRLADRVQRTADRERVEQLVAAIRDGEVDVGAIIREHLDRDT